MVDWSTLVLELRKSGVSDSRTAQAVGRSRRWVWDLANIHTEPRWTDALKLLDFASDHLDVRRVRL